MLTITSVKFRIVASISAVMFVCTSVFVAVQYASTKESTFKASLKRHTDNLQRTQANLTEYVNKSKKVVSSLSKEIARGSHSEDEVIKKISLVASTSEFNRIYYGADGKVYSSDGGVYTGRRNIVNEDWYRVAKGASNEGSVIKQS